MISMRVLLILVSTLVFYGQALASRGAFPGGDIGPISNWRTARTPVEPVMRQPFRVVVDAGHGGYDTGAIGGSVVEKDAALDIAKRLGALLQKEGMAVTYTRSSDTFVSLDERTAIAKRANAQLFVSIHLNSSASRDLRGVEVYCLPPDGMADARVRNKRFAIEEIAPPGPLHQEAALSLRKLVWEYDREGMRRDAYAFSSRALDEMRARFHADAYRLRHADFRVLLWTDCPSVLVETGYLSNAEDRRLLRSPVYRQLVARALAEAATGFVRSKEAAV